MADTGSIGSIDLYFRRFSMRSVLDAIVAISAVAGALSASALAEPRKHVPEAADQTLGTAIMSALVEQDGDLADGAGALSSTYDIANKFYTVRFNRPLAHCVGTATAILGGVIASSFVNQSGDTVRVETYGHEGTPGGNAFQLVVFCAR